MNWQTYINGFESYLMLEMGLAQNSIDAYMGDIDKLLQWTTMQSASDVPLPTSLEHKDLTEFIIWIGELGMSDKSQARIIAGIRAFYRYLLLEDLITDDPSELLQAPKLQRKMPDVLSYEEIESIFNTLDLSHPQGQRNRAILETLYATGIRVSELIGLRISNYYPDLYLIKVIGKGNKERIVPIGGSAIKYIDIYMNTQRRLMNYIDPQHEDILFLNRRGRQLSRVMIFTMIKQTVQQSGITKKVSPHTFRHSFATHLVEGGADLKAVQDMLGHESITTTEIYTHLDTHYLRDVLENFHPLNKKTSD